MLESTVLGTVFSFTWLRLEQSRCDMFLSFPGTTLMISLRWICLVQSLAIPCNPDQGPAKREECRLPFQRFFFLEGLPASHCQRPDDFWGLSKGNTVAVLDWNCENVSFSNPVGGSVWDVKGCCRFIDVLWQSGIGCGCEYPNGWS